MPLILPGNVAAATASTVYSIANSCRFNDGDSPSLEKTSGTPTSGVKGTFSFWFKRGELGTSATKYFISTNDVSTPYFQMYIGTSSAQQDSIRVQVFTGGTTTELITSRKFRDPAAWYHLVFSYDSTPSTPSSSSIRLFINGVQETAFSTETYPSQNAGHNFEDGNIMVGAANSGPENFFDGYLAEFVYCDGQAYAASDFGEFDSDSPTIWKPKDVSGLTFGTNGFYLDFEASDNLGNDANGGTDLGETNLAAVDQCTDTPTNNFATLNPLWRSSFDNDGTYSEGNCQRSFTSANSDRGYGFSTMGVTAGKWYWEIKIPDSGRTKCGVGDATKIASFTGAFYNESTSYGMEVGTDGSISENGTTTDPFAASLSDDDIVMFALDMDNHRCWYGINGTWQDSGDPTSGATGTGDITTQISDQTHINTGEFIFPFVYKVSTSGQGDFQCNFGNPPFTLSSAVADGNGYGAFEYAPPSGFLALCTKNLGSDGG